MCVWGGGGAFPSCDFRKRNQEGRRGAKARDTLKLPCVFNLSPLAPSTLWSQMLQKIILLCFFPSLSGNDLTTARKRNAKHSLELFVTSERCGGPCSSASLDIPEHTQPKTPNSWRRPKPPRPHPTPKQSRGGRRCPSHLALCCGTAARGEHYISQP